MAGIGIIGGTFDPIHNGHLITAQLAFEARRLAKLIFIPCYISPHKQLVQTASGFHRLEMLKLAIENLPNFEVSDFEISKENISYSVDTIRHFKEKYRAIDLIIGYDNLVVFDSWKEPDAIIEMANLVVLRRNSNVNRSDFHKYFGIANYLDSPNIEISASQIRERIKAGKSIKGFVPDKVENYIFENNLYK